MSSWREYRCPLCGWLHPREKWDRFLARDYEVNNWGKIRSSTGRSFTDMGKLTFEDVPDQFLRQIADRTLLLLGFFYRRNLIDDEDILSMTG